MSNGIPGTSIERPTTETVHQEDAPGQEPQTEETAAPSHIDPTQFGLLTKEQAA